MWPPLSMHVALRIALVAAVLFGFVDALVLATAPDLHCLVHHDADDQDHVCLVTILASDGCEPSAPVLQVASALPVTDAALPAESGLREHPFVGGDCRPRGPPGGWRV